MWKVTTIYFFWPIHSLKLENSDPLKAWSCLYPVHYVIRFYLFSSQSLTLAAKFDSNSIVVFIQYRCHIFFLSTNNDYNMWQKCNIEKCMQDNVYPFLVKDKQTSFFNKYNQQTNIILTSIIICIYTCRHKNIHNDDNTYNHTSYMK